MGMDSLPNGDSGSELNSLFFESERSERRREMKKKVAREIIYRSIIFTFLYGVVSPMKQEKIFACT